MGSKNRTFHALRKNFSMPSCIVDYGKAFKINSIQNSLAAKISMG